MLCLTHSLGCGRGTAFKGSLVSGKPVQCMVRGSFSKEEPFLQAGLGDRALLYRCTKLPAQIQGWPYSAGVNYTFHSKPVPMNPLNVNRQEVA